MNGEALDDLEILADGGLEIQRDAEGKIVHTVLSPERAKQMNQKRWHEVDDAQVRVILKEAGFDEDHPAPKLVEVAVREICHPRGRRSNLGKNIAILLRMIGEQPVTTPRHPKPGEPCPVCGVWDTHVPGAAEAAMRLLNVAEQYRAEKAGREAERP